MIPSSASAQPLLEAKGLTREFDDGQVQALRGVDFSIREGEFIAITGPSGCGKSTLLQLLGLLDHPTSGTLLYRGNSVPDLPDPAAYRASEIGFIFQAFISSPLSPRPRMCRSRCLEPSVRFPGDASARRSCSSWSGWKIGPIIFPPNFPAANASGSRSRAAWPTNRRFS